MFQRRYWRYLVVMLLMFLLISPKVFQVVKELSLMKVIEIGELKIEQFNIRKHLSSQGHYWANIRTTFDYGEGGPIPILHGGINTLFRPFFWRAENVRDWLCSLEIWFISLGMFFSWARMGRTEWRLILRNRATLVAVLVCIPFFFFFTYMVNEGILARQRVQVFPALLVLFAMPLVQGKWLGTDKESAAYVIKQPCKVWLAKFLDVFR